MLKTVDVAINHSETLLEVIDLIVENLVMGMDGNLAINEGVHCFINLFEILSVQVLELTNQALLLTAKVLSKLLLRELLLLLRLSELWVLWLGNLLLTPGLLLLLRRHSIGRLHEESGASV